VELLPTYWILHIPHGNIIQTQLAYISRCTVYWISQYNDITEYVYIYVEIEESGLYQVCRDEVGGVGEVVVGVRVLEYVPVACK